jgi:P27 family predicted phage terminase small subunit
MRGRKPRPTAQQLAEGDPRKIGMRKLRSRLESEAKAACGLPKCPSHLKGLARKQWKVWSRELVAMRLDRRPDGPMLEAACLNYAAAIELHDTLQKQGRFFVKRSVDPQTGKFVAIGIKSHPAVAQLNAAWALVRAFCSEFGFSPISRSRLAIEKPAGGEDELEKILSQPRPLRSEQSTEVIQ